MKRYLMSEMTVKEVREALKKTSTVLLPIGCCEQHGYHLTLDTDIRNAEEISRRVAEKFPCLVAPTLNYSFSGGQLPGTINVDPHVLALFVEQIIMSLYHQGFKRIGVVLGHGGSELVGALKEGLRCLHWMNPDRPDLQIILLQIWEFSPTMMKAVGDRDYHAGKIETSLMMYWKPDGVRKKVVMDGKDLAELMRQDPDYYQELLTQTDSEHEIPHARQRPAIKVGVMGYPEQASASLGQRVCREMVNNIVKALRDIDAQTRSARKDRRRSRHPDAHLKVFGQKLSEMGE